MMPKKVKYVKLKNYKGKIKSLFIIYADLVPKDNEKQNPDSSCTNKSQNHIACSYGYKLVYVDEDAVYNFIHNMIKESKYSSEVIKTF